VDEQGRPHDVSGYTCHHCRAEWRSCNGGELIPRAAFDAGAREPIPTASVHSPEDRE
jgi:hypothetical protein